VFGFGLETGLQIDTLMTDYDSGLHNLFLSLWFSLFDLHTQHPDGWMHGWVDGTEPTVLVDGIFVALPAEEALV
jgi:hypothetical protein